MLALHRNAQIALSIVVALYPDVDEPLVQRLTESGVNLDNDSLADAQKTLTTFLSQRPFYMGKLLSVKGAIEVWRNGPLYQELKEQLFNAQIRPNFAAFLKDRRWFSLTGTVLGIYPDGEPNSVSYQLAWDEEFFSPNCTHMHTGSECLQRASLYGRQREVVDYVMNVEFDPKDYGIALRTAILDSAFDDSVIVQALASKSQDPAIQAAFVDAATTGKINSFDVLYPIVKSSPEILKMASRIAIVEAAYGSHLPIVERLLNEPEIRNDSDLLTEVITVTIWSRQAGDYVGGYGHGGDDFLYRYYKVQRGDPLLLGRDIHHYYNNEAGEQIVELVISVTDLTLEQIVKIYNRCLTSKFSPEVFDLPKTFGNIPDLYITLYESGFPHVVEYVLGLSEDILVDIMLHEVETGRGFESSYAEDDLIRLHKAMRDNTYSNINRILLTQAPEGSFKEYLLSVIGQ